MTGGRASFALPLDVQRRFDEIRNAELEANEPAPRKLQTLLTSREVAEALRVSERTLRRLVRQGDLVATYVGRLPRFHVDDVLAFIDGSRGRR